MPAIPAPVLAALTIAALTLGACDRPPTSSPAAAVPTPGAAQLPAPADPNAPVSTASTDAAARPNVVIFLVDTLRADRLGTYGYTARPTSPNIDALAAESVVFEQASAAAPWTLPSVASLFTSTYPCEHQLLTRRERLSPGVRTLAQRLRQARYWTVSLFANAFLGPDFGLGRGFTLLKPSQRNNADKVREVLPDSDRPFFLYLHNMEPHDPHHHAPKALEGFAPIDDEIRAKIKMHFEAYKRAGEHDYRHRQPLGTTDLTAEQDQHLHQLLALRDAWSELYDASVRVADRRVGSVIELLRRRNLWDNTVFILLSDHGEEFGEHGGWLHDQSVYQELLHVPLIIHFPRNEFAGRRIAEPVSLVDVLPTLLSYLGLSQLAADARGRDLMPLLRSEPWRPPSPLLVAGLRDNRTRYYRPWAETRGDVNIALRSGWFKGIWNQGPDTLELYDLRTDPAERTDVAARHATLADAMRTFAREWYQHCLGARQEVQEIEALDEETLRNLRALGYVE